MRAFIYSVPLLLSLFLAVVSAASVVVPFSDSHIQYVGRTATTTNGAVMSWSGVTISAKFSGSTSVSAFFINNGQSQYFHVFIDGLEKALLHVTSSGSQVEYSLATGLTTGAHTVTLVKQNEALFGPVTFAGFGLSTGGALVTPDARPSKRIEFIGDSITCGYGDLGTLGCAFSAETEDVYQSHGPIAARALGADVMVSAWSGDGLVRNYADPNQQSSNPLPSFYNLAVAGNPEYGTWDFTKWVPQAVVINLGTNDYSAGNTPTQSQYQTGYVNFINTIKSYYDPDPAFFLVCGPMSQDYCTYAQNVANQVGATFINEWGMATAFGCDYHPTVAVQTNMATLEASTIGSVLGWPVTTPTSPPTPPPSTQNIYTDSMQGSWLDYSWATHSLSNTNPVHSGSDSISFTLDAWVGLFFYQFNEIYLSSAYHFVFYVNGGSLSNVPLVVSATDYNGNVAGVSVSIPTAIAAGTWVTESIPGTAFNVPSGSPVYGFSIMVNSDSLTGVIYVDDVSLTVTQSTTTAASTSSTAATSSTSSTSTHATTATTATSTTAKASTTTTTTTGSPTVPPVHELIYDDQLRNSWQDWSWGTHSLSNSNPVYSGTYSISFSLEAWTGIYLSRPTTVALSSFSSLNFYVNGGSLNNVPLVVTLEDANSNLIGNSVSPPVSVKANQWVLETIPVSSFGVALSTQISGFIIQFNSGTDSGVIYLDQVYFA